MAPRQQPDGEAHKRQEAAEALQEFERILEVMPDDRGSLEAAIFAAEAAALPDKELTHRLALTQLLLLEGDLEAAEGHLSVLRDQADDARVADWLAVYDPAVAGGAAAQVAVTPSGGGEAAGAAAVAAGSTFDLSEEIDMAWRLHESQLLTEDEYAGLVSDLTEMSSQKDGGTVSVLHALEARVQKNLESILAHLQQVTRTPYISLAGFASRPELVPLLPEAFIEQRGAMVFDLLGKECLVAVLNPFSAALRQEVERRLGAACHYYLVRASDFDAAAERLREMAEEE
jgi:hypothetical protein